MALLTNEEPPPESTDLEGWRRAIRNGCHGEFPMEAVVAAIQDLGPNADGEVISALVLLASDTILEILRRLVGRHHPNEGVDIIDDAHARLIDAVLAPDTPDGQGLREAFIPRIQFRVADAIRRDQRKNARERTVKDINATCDAKAADDVSVAGEMEGRLHVEEVLSLVTDERKRLAFRLHMDGIPLGSKRTTSIAGVLGVSSKTAGEWITEVQEQLRQIVGEQS